MQKRENEEEPLTDGVELVAGEEGPSEQEDLCQEQATLKHALQKSLSCLQSAEVVLVDPTPSAIEMTTNLLEDAMAHFESLRELSVAANSEDLIQLKLACERVRTMLDGALRAQWHHMRHMGSFQERYAPGDKREQWKPRISSFTLEG